MSHSLNTYKALAGRACDEMLNPGHVMTPYLTALLTLMKNRKTKGARAALLSGLIVGALCDRGRADVAEQFTKDIAQIMRDTNED